MYVEDTYKVKAVLRASDGRDLAFDARQHIPSGTAKYRSISDIDIPEGVEVDVEDIVRLRIENHSTPSSRQWVLDRFIGFPYDKERGWDYFNGIGESED